MSCVGCFLYFFCFCCFMDVHLNLLRSHFALQAITFDMSALWMSPAAEEPVWLGVVYVFLEYFLTLPPPFPSRRYRRLSPACQRCPFALSHRQTHANHIPFYTPLFSCLLAAYEFFSTCLVFNRFWVRLLNVVLRVVSVWVALLSQALRWWWWFAKSLTVGPSPCSRH